MRIALIGVAASAVLVSASAIGIAQVPGGSEPPGKMQGPAVKQPGGKAEGSQAPGAGKGETQRTPDAGQDKGTRESQGAPGQDQPKARESQYEKSQPKSSQSQPDKAQPKASEGQPEKGQPKSSQGQQGQPKATERQPEKSQPKSSQGQPDRGQKSTQGQQPGNQHAANRVQVTEQQRSTVRERLFKEGKFQKTRLNVRVNVGTRVPRSVHLLPLPLFIAELAPSYRGYTTSCSRMKRSASSTRGPMRSST